ncbi:hypothetical protein Pan14r_00230 [Crateriforma conspicua]|uniref:Uncharacterized protein n=1 Tax=Crateriforma conspicua TaxID=2527996 RepID=A0A5C5XWN8_9PLAN|nr:hypothetical protein Pan14r_00230 [Crateriforma conspicua]
MGILNRLVFVLRVCSSWFLRLFNTSHPCRFTSCLLLFSFPCMPAGASETLPKDVLRGYEKFAKRMHCYLVERTYMEIVDGEQSAPQVSIHERCGTDAVSLEYQDDGTGERVFGRNDDYFFLIGRPSQEEPWRLKTLFAMDAEQASRPSPYLDSLRLDFSPAAAGVRVGDRRLFTAILNGDAELTRVSKEGDSIVVLEVKNTRPENSSWRVRSGVFRLRSDRHYQIESGTFEEGNKSGDRAKCDIANSFKYSDDYKAWIVDSQVYRTRWATPDGSEQLALDFHFDYEYSPFKQIPSQFQLTRYGIGEPYGLSQSSRFGWKLIVAALIFLSFCAVLVWRWAKRKHGSLG